MRFENDGPRHITNAERARGMAKKREDVWLKSSSFSHPCSLPRIWDFLMNLYFHRLQCPTAQMNSTEINNQTSISHVIHHRRKRESLITHLSPGRCIIATCNPANSSMEEIVKSSPSKYQGLKVCLLQRPDGGPRIMNDSSCQKMLRMDGV